MSSPPAPSVSDDATGPLTAAIDGVMVSAVHPGSDSAHMVYVSEGLADIIGIPIRELLGKAPDTVFADSTPAQQLDAVASLVAQGKQAMVPMALRTANGPDLAVHATFLAVPSLSDGWPLYLSMFRVDRTTQTPPPPASLSGDAVFDQTELFDALAHPGSLDDIVIHLGERAESFLGAGRVVMALAYAHEPTSARFDLVRTAGLKPELLAKFFEAVRSDRSITSPTALPVASLPLETAIEFQNAGVASVWLTPMLRNDGEVMGAVAVAHPEQESPSEVQQQLLNAVARLAVVAMDRSRREADLALRALHDPLTRLPNRDWMTDRLDQLIDLSQRSTGTGSEHGSLLSVVMVDVDRFRAFNDRYGSLAGDHVLTQTAERLRSVLRVGDTIGRVGPDQFLVVCPERRDDADAFSAAEELRSAVVAPIELPDGTDAEITASVGLVLVHPDDDLTPTDVMSNAEAAVDAAHDAGRDQVSVFDAELRRQLAARHELEEALRDAIDEDELFLLYQPIIEVRTGQMMGAEALVRWDRPGHGVLPPALFIDIAEDSGLIIEIGDWVIREACRQIAEWPERLAGGRPTISVNLSARQLSHPSLMDTVTDALAFYDVDPTSVGFEVTESMKVEDLERASASLVDLAALGCHLSIDDFGIGYATLDYLRRFHMAHTLKVDRSFVDGLGTSREDTAIVSASVTLAESLGLTVVAEGVETVDQLEYLHQLGADYAQGYLLSKPVELDEAHLLWHRATLIPGNAF
ncbi:MAG: putative bifunctional diguanylate cyclase/phosphodiesterase [Acidimicrobiales bacterium]